MIIIKVITFFYKPVHVFVIVQEAALDVLLERDQILWDLLDGYSDSVAIDYVK